MKSQTVILVGSRVKMECGHDPSYRHLGRDWRITLDDEDVHYIVDVTLQGLLDGVGERTISIRKTPGAIDPDEVFISYMQRHGWGIIFVEQTEEDKRDGVVETTDQWDGGWRNFVLHEGAE